MNLKDELVVNPEVYGVFNIKTFDKDNNIIEDWTDPNLIVYTARAVMAGSIGSYVASTEIQPINKFYLGTRGHRGDNILDTVLVGEEQTGMGLFDPERTQLFSQESGEYNYGIEFNPTGGKTVTRETLAGTLYSGTVSNGADEPTNTIKREITGLRENEVKYTITIETPNANVPGQATPYTEAALYAGDNLFAMKTFPARVKESTVKFVITWSIIF